MPIIWEDAGDVVYFTVAVTRITTERNSNFIEML